MENGYKTGFYGRFVKRLLDFLLSLCAIIVLSPVLLVLAVLVRKNLGSPVLFSQDRPGRNEKIFKIYKFRSMKNALDSEGNPLPDEQRLTPFGRKLRASSLDELPELFSILKGDMAIIGPRPLLPEYLPYYTPEEHHRHDVRPGLTGLAQINGRNNLSWDKALKMDIDYVKSISFAGDVKIFFGTIGKVLKQADVLSGDEKTVGRMDDERRAEKENQ